MVKRYYRKKYYKRNYNDNLIGYLILFGIFLVVSFILKYKFYILIALFILVLIVFIIFIYNLDLKGNLKTPQIYYKGESQKNRLEELKKNEVKNAYLINCINKGIYGEERVLYTLNQSDIPMKILHDLNLEIDGIKAQIDIIAITKKNIYLLEVKNLKGNSLIDEYGNFIRNLHGKKKGMKNPITQSIEHESVIKRIFTKEKINEKFKSLVIMANDNAYNAYAKDSRNYADIVLRNDQLIRKIRKLDKKKIICMREKKITKICEAIMKYNKEQFIAKSDEEIKNELITYREKIKFKDNILKDYYIFKDEAIKDLIIRKPKTLEELKDVYGFSDNNISKYGADVLKIINEKNLK